MDSPLQGTTILIAASEDRTDRLAAEFARRGATAIRFPAVRIVPPPDFARLDDSLRQWSLYDWVVFTSANGVEAMMERARALSRDLVADAPRIAAVGPATKAAAEAAGLHVQAMPSEFLTAAIAETLGDVSGRSILLPRSRMARKDLADELRARGALVREVEAYDAVPPDPPAPVPNPDSIDYVVFTSASAVQNLASLIPGGQLARLRDRVQAACIGPVTAKAAKEAGFRVAVVADEHTVRGLVRSLEKEAIHG